MKGDRLIRQFVSLWEARQLGHGLTDAQWRKWEHAERSLAKLGRLQEAWKVARAAIARAKGETK